MKRIVGKFAAAAVVGVGLMGFGCAAGGSSEKKGAVAESEVKSPSGQGAIHPSPQPSPTRGEGVRRPNVVVILADDLGFADVGVQGQEKDVRTPNIDSIARNGARFTNGYVTCPVCSPTRAGFLTGRYQERFGHEFNPGPNAAGNFGLPLDQITIANVMKSAGYHTGMVGKWHEGNHDDYMPTRRGFDEFFGFLGGAHSYVDNGEGRNAIMRGEKPVEEKEYLTDAFSREAVAFIERHKSEPFFLYLPYNAVHQPQQAPEKYQERFASEKDKKRHMLLSMLSAEDDGVGRVLEALRKNHLEENTIVWFFSDNGGPTAGNGSRNKPYSGFKGQVWEGGIHEPFMVQWKGHIPAGQVLDQPVVSMDIYATSAGAAGAKVPKDRAIDGVDLMPLLMGETKERPHKTLYWRFGNQWAIRDGDWKMVHMDGFGEKLFDLTSDLGEKKDLSASEPQIASKMRGEFEKWSNQMHEPLWGNKPKFSKALERAARQLPPQPEGKSADKEDPDN